MIEAWIFLWAAASSLRCHAVRCRPVVERGVDRHPAQSPRRGTKAQALSPKRR